MIQFVTMGELQDAEFAFGMGRVRSSMSRMGAGVKRMTGGMKPPRPQPKLLDRSLGNKMMSQNYAARARSLGNQTRKAASTKHRYATGLTNVSMRTRAGVR